MARNQPRGAYRQAMADQDAETLARYAALSEDKRFIADASARRLLEARPWIGYTACLRNVLDGLGW